MPRPILASLTTLGLAALVVLALAARARAEEASGGSRDDPAATDDPVTATLVRGREHVELELGYATAMRFARESLSRQFAVASLSWGQLFTDRVGPGPLEGQLELLLQLDVYTQVKPDLRLAAGPAAVARWDFFTGTPVVPFVAASAGVIFHDLGPPEEGGRVGFQLVVGLGAHVLVSERVAVTVEYRFLHFSNAFLFSPNFGINANVVLAGASFWF